MPAGVSLEYEQLLAEVGEGCAARIFYDQGRMEIMATAFPHERAKSVIHDLVVVLSDELDIDVESFGSTTFRAEMKSKGAEPDDCFYVQNASLVIGKQENLDLTFDPPPDIALEVDHTSASLDKFPIYAALGVPEIWRVSKSTVRIHILSEDWYDESPASRAFPFLTSETLSKFLAQRLSEGERRAARAFRAWLASHRHGPETNP